MRTLFLGVAAAALLSVLPVNAQADNSRVVHCPGSTSYWGSRSQLITITPNVFPVVIFGQIQDTKACLLFFQQAKAIAQQNKINLHTYDVNISFGVYAPWGGKNPLPGANGRSNYVTTILKLVTVKGTRVRFD